jgi:hypothetical protein
MTKTKSKLEDKVLFLKDKNVNDIVYVYVLTSEESKQIVISKIEEFLSKKKNNLNFTEIWYLYADRFEIKNNKEIKHVQSGDQYTIYKSYEIYHPDRKEMDTYLKLIKEGIKQLKAEKLQRRITRLKETYAPVVEYVRYFKHCYTIHKENEATMIKKLSEYIGDIATRYRISDIRYKLLVYGRTYISVKANKDLKDFITEYIVAQIINNNALSVTNIESDSCYDVYVVIEKKYENSWCIYLGVADKSNPYEETTYEETTNAISINKKGKDENLIVKISNFVNETFNLKEQNQTNTI